MGRLGELPKSSWSNIRVERSSNQKQSLKVCDEKGWLRGDDKDIRQIAITGHGKRKPAVIITNDFENPISEEIEFFHFNRVSSSMVIK
ncbi:MAG: hypothetical protein OXE77_00005 [Flavobacteriaceae bacterium]|nr:hypothetical protein [Flavobacteriaceae bacterium]MCY4268414.1 hypothetical protein [Flavobacteriaceae bacterium]MCY4299567.1 hypothetical protein [Flavobacteriaceae bacterium]